MRVYNIALSTGLDCFSHRVRELCGANNLSFFLVEPHWVQVFVEKVQQGEIGVGVLLDMASDPYATGSLYYRLAKDVKAAGGHVIDDPDLSPLTTHKGKFHAVLEQNGLPVPETVMVRRDEIERFRLTEEMKQRIGVPFVVKPGWGGGRIGVNLDATGEADLLRAAKEAPDSDSFMLQRRLTPQTLGGRPAWFRIFHVCGEIIPCWWHPSTGDYQLVSPLQRRHYGLVALEQMVYRIAKLAGMEFFSTEITLTREGQWVAVDYLNDECDMHPKSYYQDGPPDEVVRRVAHLMVQKAITVIHKHPFQNDLIERDRAEPPPQPSPTRREGAGGDPVSLSDR